MSRNRDDPPYLRARRAEVEIVKTARWMLGLHDTGERVPEAAWEELRRRVGELDRALFADSPEGVAADG